MDISTYLGNKVLEVIRGTTFTAPAAVYVSAHTADPGLTGANEVGTAGSNGYARQQVHYSAAASKLITSDGHTAADAVALQITMPTTLGANTAVPWLGVWDAATGGNFLFKIPSLGTNFEGSVSLASPGVITIPAHGLVADNRVVVTAANIGGPTMASMGLAESTIYYVGTVPSVDTITLSTTAANANPVNTSAKGDCIIRQLSVQTFNPGNILQVASGQLSHQL